MNYGSDNSGRFSYARPALSPNLDGPINICGRIQREQENIKERQEKIEQLLKKLLLRLEQHLPEYLKEEQRFHSQNWK